MKAIHYSKRLWWEKINRAKYFAVRKPNVRFRPFLNYNWETFFSQSLKINSGCTYFLSGAPKFMRIRTRLKCHACKRESSRERVTKSSDDQRRRPSWVGLRKNFRKFIVSIASRIIIIQNWIKLPKIRSNFISARIKRLWFWPDDHSQAVYPSIA